MWKLVRHVSPNDNFTMYQSYVLTKQWYQGHSNIYASWPAISCHPYFSLHVYEIKQLTVKGIKQCTCISFWSCCWTNHPFTKAAHAFTDKLTPPSHYKKGLMYLLTHVVRPRSYKEVKVDISSSNSPLPPGTRYMVKCRGGGWSFKLIHADNWALQLDSVQIVTLDTKKHQQSAPVARPRLLFASLPSTMHCLLYYFMYIFPFSFCLWIVKRF